MEGVRIKGLHEPLVSEELFSKVQDVLGGRKPSVAARKRHNPALPLKWFVRCATCGTPLTGGFSTGKNKARKYGHYWCRNKNCRAVLVSNEKLESDFLALLRRLEPDKAVIASFPSVAAYVWAQKQGDAETSTKRLLTKLDSLKRLKLLRAKLRGEVAQGDYQQANREFADEIASIEEQVQIVKSSKATLEKFVSFAELMLVDIVGAWQKAAGDQRQRVQNLLFSEGLLYSEDDGFLKHA